MAERQGIDTLIPDLQVRIDEQDIVSEVRADLISVSVLEDVNSIGTFTFTLLCWDGVEMQVKWIDDDMFETGNNVEIKMGYRDDLKTLFKGEITGLEPEFPEDAPPTLTVRGYDRRHRLMGKIKTRTFTNMKDSDIAGQIAGDWGLTPETEDSQVTIDYVLQHNQSDLEFMQSRAQRIGYEVVISDRTLYFRARRNSGNATVTLRREVELIDFSVRLSIIGQVEEVFVRGWDPSKKQEYVARSAAGEEPLMGNSATGSTAARQAFGNTGETSVDRPVLSQAEADQLAASRLKEIAMTYIEGYGLCIGIADLRAGELVEIEGVGRRFSGPYYVTSAEHRYSPSSGYRTAITVRRNAT
ncbi:MAG: phage late control D family protein [Desulfobulbaceae bacterium]|nr:phage late control D family protein [Desulfobulbaceae bacterium]